jgi:hypothetical protein
VLYPKQMHLCTLFAALDQAMRPLVSICVWRNGSKITMFLRMIIIKSLNIYALVIECVSYLNSDSSAESRSFELSKRTSIVTKPRISSADSKLVSLLPSLATTIRASNLRFPIRSPYLLRRSSACMFVSDDLIASDIVMVEGSPLPPAVINCCGDCSQNASTMNFAALITDVSEPSRGVNLISIVDSFVVGEAAVSSSADDASVAASLAKNMSSFIMSFLLLWKAAPFVVENEETMVIVSEPQRAEAASSSSADFIVGEST